ncbi:EAL domain-containing protein [Rhodococcus sp. G-MC3]|uniref:sensor domain-containing phosphodiesterase n=1 Tax=Rhodococcus sp. G-MC3 TaxID=3046209 RepID=UPI0024B95D40|nr:EAL domain-containing protein [Rhodococcus sp. G-MC3]MDJ0394134.1 EAL domain-containing protein [Rhodococcus sp. G-MC3]
MFRSRNDRQNESARKYLDFAAVSPALENAAEVTARALEYPIAMVHIIDESSQYTLVGYGAGNIAGTVIPRAHSACTSVVELGLPVVVEDSAAPENVGHESDLPADLVNLLLDHGIRAYVAVPLFGRESVPIGTLCVFDVAPRKLSEDRLRLLEQLAVMVEEHLDAQRGRARVERRTASVAELTRAVDGGEIVPWYQPIVDLGSGEVFAMEALARWDHPVLGLTAPGEFIEQMENTDLIVDLDVRILAQAVSDFYGWVRARPTLMLSVNISGHHLDRPDCIDRITSVVGSAGVSAKSIVLEITETARGPGIDDEARTVAALRERGFTVLLDDLGSGWAPVSRLTHVSVDGFKLDRSIAASLHTTVGEAVARAMLQFADDLDHRVVLEGIDTPAKLALAMHAGFAYGQGHLFSKPIPAENVPLFLGSTRDRPRVSTTLNPK